MNPPTYTFWILEFLLRTEFYSLVFFRRLSLGAWRGQGYPKNTMKISKSVTKILIWPSLLKTRTFTIAWMVIDRSTLFTAITNQSMLCTKEKFCILIMPKMHRWKKSQEVGTHWLSPCFSFQKLRKRKFLAEDQLTVLWIHVIFPGHYCAHDDCGCAIWNCRKS